MMIHRLYTAVVKYIILSKMLKLKRDQKLHLRHRACTAVFFQEHLLNAYKVINQGCTNIARPLEMVKSSIQFMNNPVLLLGDVLRTGTTKYSSERG